MYRIVFALSMASFSLRAENKDVNSNNEAEQPQQISAGGKEVQARKLDLLFPKGFRRNPEALVEKMLVGAAPFGAEKAKAPPKNPDEQLVTSFSGDGEILSLQRYRHPYYISAGVVVLQRQQAFDPDEMADAAWYREQIKASEVKGLHYIEHRPKEHGDKGWLVRLRHLYLEKWVAIFGDDQRTVWVVAFYHQDRKEVFGKWLFDLVYYSGFASDS